MGVTCNSLRRVRPARGVLGLRRDGAGHPTLSSHLSRTSRRPEQHRRHDGEPIAVLCGSANCDYGRHRQRLKTMKVSAYSNSFRFLLRSSTSTPLAPSTMQRGQMKSSPGTRSVSETWSLLVAEACFTRTSSGARRFCGTARSQADASCGRPAAIYTTLALPP